MKETDMGKLEGKIALITGGTSGIGLATAQQFVHEGAYVFITGRREPELAAAVKEIGSHVTGVQGDVANLGDLDRLFSVLPISLLDISPRRLDRHAARSHESTSDLLP